MNKEYKMNGSEKFMGVLLILVMALIPLICKVAVVPVSVDEYNVVRHRLALLMFLAITSQYL